MKRAILAVVVASLALFGANKSFGGTLLINQVNPYLAYGYGLSDWGNTTAALNAAFGAPNITVSSATLNTTPGLLGYDALWVTARQPGSSLTPAEQASLSAFIATGKPVVMIGENNSWTAWNNSILAPVGGNYTGSDTSGTLTPVLVHPLTAGVTSWNTAADGIANGGTSLFNVNVATLWGANVVSVLSVNAIDDPNGGSASNLRFESNLANFLASGQAQATVPEPASITLFGMMAVGGAVYGWRRRRHAAA